MPDRNKGSVSTLIEMNRPTTAPVMIDGVQHRSQFGKIKSAAPSRAPPPPRAPPAPLRAPRLIDSASNYDNLTAANLLHLTDGLKPSIFKSDNHFVHQLCSSTVDNQTDLFSTSRDSFLDISNGTFPCEISNEKPTTTETQNETTDDDLEETKVKRLS